MFDPSIGRWLEEDPIGFNAGDANLYRYAGNDPVNRTDPSGLEEQPVAMKYVSSGRTHTVMVRLNPNRAFPPGEFQRVLSELGTAREVVFKARSAVAALQLARKHQQQTEMAARVTTQVLYGVFRYGLGYEIAPMSDEEINKHTQDIIDLTNTRLARWFGLGKQVDDLVLGRVRETLDKMCAGFVLLDSQSFLWLEYGANRKPKVYAEVDFDRVEQKIAPAPVVFYDSYFTRLPKERVALILHEFAHLYGELGKDQAYLRDVTTKAVAAEYNHVLLPAQYARNASSFEGFLYEFID